MSVPLNVFYAQISLRILNSPESRNTVAVEKCMAKVKGIRTILKHVGGALEVMNKAGPTLL